MLGEFAADGVPGPDACGEGVCDGRLGKLQRDHKLQFRKGSKKTIFLENFPKLVTPPPLTYHGNFLSLFAKEVGFYGKKTYFGVFRNPRPPPPY